MKHIIPANYIANWVANLQYEEIPASVMTLARLCIIDVAGVMVAGTQTDISKLIAEYVRSRRGRPLATAVGWGFKGEPTEVALLNGVSGHALDFDDTNYSLIGHSSAVIFPAVLAAGEEAKASGREVLEAFVVGTEVACKLGQAFNPNLFDLGWFTTASLGVFGAAIGCARLWRLPAPEIQTAMSIAGGMAGGLRVNNGTMAKPYQAGHASRAGLEAAMLARSGVQGVADVFESTDGYIDVHARGKANFSPLLTLGQPFDMVDPGILFKRYPACSGAGAAVDALLAILDENKIDTSRIESIECEATDLVGRSMPYRNPQTYREAQFSLPYCLAAAWVFGKVDLATFTEEALRDARVQIALEHVDTLFDLPDPTGRSEAAVVTVRLRGGHIFRKRCESAAGSPENPLTPEQLYDKFRYCASGRLRPTEIEETLEVLKHIDEYDLAQVIECLTGEEDKE